MGSAIPAMARIAVTSVLMLASATVASPQGGGQAADGEYGDYEQVPYTTVRQFNGYEERQYPGLKWVCTEGTYPIEKEDESGFLTKLYQMVSQKRRNKRRASSEMFRRLFQYISGVNQQREEIEMTVPVLSEKTPSDVRQYFTISSLYIDYHLFVP